MILLLSLFPFKRTVHTTTLSSIFMFSKLKENLLSLLSNRVQML